jgi:hypothetical protein
VLIILMLLAVWCGAAALGLRQWQRNRALAQRDAQLKALLAGSLVPGPRVPGLPAVTTAQLASAHVARRTGAAATG